MEHIKSVQEESLANGKSEENFRKKGRFPMYRKMSDIKPQPINWLWKDYIAKGTFTLITGEPELGKSQITLSMAAIVTTGENWPVSGEKCEEGNVIILSDEDNPEKTIHPRLEANGANIDKIHYF